ncbi:MAG: ribosome biogenesis protein tsr3 [Chaenotheca gracillima]|nr:MAG: ribosome biogenesis protein tsr3 [Chaenotheca gracillima]
MAARDRFGGALGEPGLSPLQRYIQSACDPTNYEANLALDLEIADLINSKKGNAPREAAVAIVNFINHRNVNVSMLAITLLDICVKNCGYPFQLQISTKEFLNELVRRFPERPPIRPTRVQLKILEAIEEWRQTICQTSRYKEDLGYIRDMHRLLSYKGYMFPEIRREDAAVLNPTDNLKSAEEMEEEERAAQSAKLQELIRRGGPEELQEANRLMKVMAGFDTRHKTDYRAKAAEEVGKIQQKAKILEEMLQGYKQGDMLSEGDVFEELASALQNAQPKIQKMCEEESDDSEAVAKLLEINDSIHRTIERYKLVKKGDIEAANKIPQGTLGSKTGVGKTADNELSLIDFEGEESATSSERPNASTSNGTQSQTNSLEDDLLGLSFQDSSYGQGGGISLGLGANSNAGAPGPAALSPGFQQNAAKPPTPSISPGPQGAGQPAGSPLPSQPNYSAFASSFASQPPSQSVTPKPSLLEQQARQQQRPPTQPASDPFASLTPAAPQTSPFPGQQQNTQAPTLSSDLLSLGQPTAPQAPPKQNTTSDADEWTFASSLPEPSAPAHNEISVTKSTVEIGIGVSRSSNPGDNTIALKAKFSSNDSRPITDLTFQTAGLSLKLQPQSGRSLAPLQREGITQLMYLHGVENGKGNTVKMRWKVSYKVSGEHREEQGEIPSLGVA